MTATSQSMASMLAAGWPAAVGRAATAGRGLYRAAADRAKVFANSAQTRATCGGIVVLEGGGCFPTQGGGPRASGLVVAAIPNDFRLPADRQDRRVKLEGIHHVTCITGDAPANVEFYAGR